MNERIFEAERAVLGALLVSEGAALDEVLPVLGEDASFFQHAHHRNLYQAVLRIHRAGRAADSPALLQELGDFGRVGGAEYLCALTGCVGSSARARHYAEAVRDNVILRALSGRLAELRREADAGGAPGEILEKAEAALLELSLKRATSDSVPLGSLLPRVLEHLRVLGEANGRVTGIASGIHGLDRLTGGFKPGQLVVIAARPGIGKTAALLNFIHHASARCATAAQLFSLEMSREELGARLLGIAGGLSLLSLQRGFQVRREMEKADAAARRLDKAPVEIVDEPRLNVAAIRGHLRRFVARRGLPALAAVDYVQLLHSGEHKNRARYEEVAAISGQLKQLARECRVPMLAACQLSRQAEGVGDGFKALQYLRESGSLEQDADAVVILGKPGDDEARQIAALGGNADDLLSVCLAKNRHGQTGRFYVRFDKPSQRLLNLADSGRPDSIPCAPTAHDMEAEEAALF